jgi:hypothetical protein
LRLLASARTAHRQKRIGATIVAALLGTAVHEVASDLAADGTATGGDTGHGRNAGPRPRTDPGPAADNAPDALADEAAAVSAESP